MLKIGTILQNRYAIEDQIGQGGMGAVYKAIDQKFSESNRVAIKETFYESAELAEAFEREARLLNSLHHPILPHVSDYFSEGGGSFLVMEYIDGEDLSAILKRDGAFPLDDVLRWTKEILDGLDYLHSQEPPVIHRDIKPNNLKLTSRGHIVLLDFGLAKETDDATLSDRSVFGYSRKYSPLEQIEGVGSDARSDIFSLGATVYQLLTGQPPVDALARASAIVSGQPDTLWLASEMNPEIPEPVARVIHSALALNVDQRFASANAMRAALDYAMNPDAPIVPFENGKSAVPPTEDGFAMNAVEVVSFPALQAFKAELEENSTDGDHSAAAEHVILPAAFADNWSEQAEAPLPIHDDTAVVEEFIDEPAAFPVETRDLGAVDESPGYAAQTSVEEVPATTSEQIERYSRPTPALNYDRPTWHRGAFWAALVFAGVLALIYGLSRTASDDLVQPRTQIDSATAVSGDQTAATNEVPTAAEDTLPQSDETTGQDTETASDSHKKNAKPAAPIMQADDNEPEEESATVPSARRQAASPETVPRNQEPAREVAPASRQPVQQARRGTRAAEPLEPVSSIENVFTGTSWEPRRRNAQRRGWEVRTYEDGEEYRRERRRIRRQMRRQEQIWPF